MPEELLPVLMAKAWPQHSLEDLEGKDDIAPLLRGAVLWNYYQTMTQADWQNPPKVVGEFLDYELYLDMGMGEEDAEEVARLKWSGKDEEAQKRLTEFMETKKAGQ